MTWLQSISLSIFIFIVSVVVSIKLHNVANRVNRKTIAFRLWHQFSKGVYYV